MTATTSEAVSTADGLYYLRELSGLTLEQTAERTGVTPRSLRRAEGGEGVQSIGWVDNVMTVLADELGLPTQAQLARNIVSRLEPRAPR